MNQEDMIIKLTELTVSVNDLSAVVRDLLEVQREQSRRLSQLELAPLQQYQDTRREVMRALAGALWGAAVGAALTWLTQGVL